MNDYEIQFDQNSGITPIEDDKDIKKISYSFTKIGNIQEVAPNAIIDIIGVVTNVSDLAKINSKTTNKELIKRDITLADDTMAQISCTLWGDRAQNSEINAGDIIAMKGVKVSDYGGRTISTLNSTVMEKNAENNDVYALKGWFESNQGNLQLHSLSEAKGSSSAAGAGGVVGNGALSVLELRETLQSVKDKHLGHSEKADIFVLKGCITYIRAEDPNKLWYASCGAPGNDGKPCLKKATENSDGSWSCDRGDKVSQPTYRYIVNATVNDFTGQEYISIFDTDAAQILSRSANDMHDEVVQTSASPGQPMAEESAFNQTLKSSYFEEYLFTIRAKTEMVKDENKVKYSVIKVKGIDYARESRILATGIKKYFA